jgi:hypothetical protein
MKYNQYGGVTGKWLYDDVKNLRKKGTMAEKQKEAAKLRTPWFRASFAQNLFKAQAMEGGTPKYSVVALFPEGADLKAMKAAAFKAGKERFGAKWVSEKGQWPKKFRSPFRDGAEKEDMDGYGEGVTFCTLSANVEYPPSVFDKDVTRIDPTDPSAKQIFYSGCWAEALIRPYAYDAGGNKGVAFGLLGIQKVKEDKRFGGGVGASADDFSAVEDESDDADNYGDAENEDGDDTGF